MIGFVLIWFSAQLRSSTALHSSIKYTVPTYTEGWWLNEPQSHLRANMVSFEKAFLYAFVVDVHSNKLISVTLQHCSSVMVTVC